MIKNVSKNALVAAALFALPGIAQAGTATATGTATLNVINQCSVTGKTVNLGAYLTTDTWAKVGAALGQWDGTTFAGGSRGLSYLDYGTVTCDAGTIYSLSIKGTQSGTNAGAIKIVYGGKTAIFLPAVKSIGVTPIADGSTTLVSAGAPVYTSPASATGTGSAQGIFGSAIYSIPGSTALPTDVLGTAGSASDTLTYTLNF